MIEETNISKAIIKTAVDDLLNNLDIDVGIAGAGPAGLTCAYYLAKGGAKVAIFERRLNFGGGLPGGGMFLPRVVVQKTALPITKQAKIRLKRFSPQFYTADSVEMASKLAVSAINAGARIFPAVFVEDVLLRENNKISGLVLNWTAVKLAGLHVDPLAVKTKFAVDATGHDADLARVVERKNPNVLFKTPSGKIMGEQSMWAEKGERLIIDYTQEVQPGLYAVGMSVCAIYGLPRMGAIFGGMLLSGKKAAQLILRKLKK
ncbi:MAG: thiazole biosynthesis protein [Candidatus Omnitrophica bacterium]|nr:thiazole biosynthesis protein [Candidatus Omnitrophota bacterium]